MDGTFVSVHPPDSLAGSVPHFYGLALPGSPMLFVPQMSPALGPAQASTQLDAEFELKCTPCPHHFGKSGAACKYGDACFFSHDLAVYKAARQLRPCPNTGCDNLCRGRQCKACHEQMVERRKARTKAARSAASRQSEE